MSEIENVQRRENRPDAQTLLPEFDDTTSVREMWDILLHQKWLILGIAVLCALLGATYGIVRRPTWTAGAQVRIDTSKSGGLTLEDLDVSLLGAEESRVRIETEARILESDTLALTVMERTHYPDRAGIATQLEKKNPAQRRESLLKSWEKALSVKPITKTNIIEIRFKSPDPQLSVDCANELLNAYIVQNYRSKYDSANQASSWISSQMDKVRTRAETAQKKLTDYQKQSGVFLLQPLTTGSRTDDNAGTLTSTEMLAVEDLSKAYTSAQVESIAKEALYRIALSGNADMMTVALADPTLNALRAQKADLDSRYAQESAEFGPEFPRLKQLSASRKDADRAIQAEIARLQTSLRRESETSKATEERISSQLDAAKARAYKQDDSVAQVLLLERDALAARKIYEELDARLNEAGVVAGLQSSNVDMIDKALAPGEPSSMKMPALIILGFCAGIFVGLLVAVGRSSLNRVVLSETELQRTVSFPLLSVIPRFHSSEAGEVTGVLPVNSPLLANSGSAESFRSLRTSILLSRPSKSARVILVASSIPGEGKSFVSANLASVFAQRGNKTLLIDADMRRGHQHVSFGLTGRLGLSQILSGAVQMNDCIAEVSQIEGLSVILAGPVPPSPPDLLDSTAAADLLEECKRRFDYVIIDSPPLLVVSDPLILGRYADGIVVVVRSALTTVQELRRTVGVLEPLRDKVIGIIFNDIQQSGSSYYENYYSRSKENKA